MQRTTKWSWMVMLGSFATSCTAGGDPYFRIQQIEDGIREARVGMVEGTEGAARAKDGDREGAEERLSLSVATMSAAHLKMATHAEAMRGMHQEDCGHALTDAIDDLEVGVRTVDEGRLDVAQDRGEARVMDGLELVDVALTGVEATLPCIAYQHSDDAQWRADLARR
jgi:hypothetical protein